MSRLRMYSRTCLAGALVLAAASGPSAAQAPSQPLRPASDPLIEERARAIGKELRCVVCQNQSIDESNAPLALDLKQLLRERLEAGDSDAQAKAFLVTRYGNFVLLKPPFQINTLLLWIGPFLLLGLALWSLQRYFAVSRGAPADTAALSADEFAQAERLLGKETGA